MVNAMTIAIGQSTPKAQAANPQVAKAQAATTGGKGLYYYKGYYYRAKQINGKRTLYIQTKHDGIISITKVLKWQSSITKKTKNIKTYSQNEKKLNK